MFTTCIDIHGEMLSILAAKKGHTLNFQGQDGDLTNVLNRTVTAFLSSGIQQCPVNIWHGSF